MKKIFFIFLTTAVLFFTFFCSSAYPQNINDADKLFTEGDTFLYVKKDYNSAIKKYEEALKVYQTKDKTYKAASCFTNIGYGYFSLGEYKQAIKYNIEALKIYAAINNEPSIGITLNAIGDCYYNLKDYKNALKYYLGALGLHHELKDTDAEKLDLTDIDLTQRFLAEEAFGKQDVIEAVGDVIKEYQKTLEVFKKINNKKGEASTFLYMGKMYVLLNQYKEGMGYYLQALKISKDISDKTAEGSTCLEIANLYANLKEHKSAIEYYLKSLEIFTEINDNFSRVKVLRSIALIYTESGEDTNALKYSDSGIEILKEKLKTGAGKSDKDALAYDMDDMAFFYRYSKRYEQAISFFKQALSLNKETGNKIMQAVNLANIGDAYFQLGEYGKTIDFYKQASAIYEGFKSDFQYATCLMNIAYAYEKSGDYENALDYYRGASGIYKEYNIPMPLFVSGWSMARAYNKLNYTKEALEAYENAILYLEKTSSSVWSEKLKSSFMKDNLQIYEEMIELLIKLKKYKEAFGYSERLKARTLVELLTNIKITNIEGVSPNLRKKEEEISAKIRGIYKQIYGELDKAPEGRDKSLLRSLGAELRKSQEEMEGVLDQIKIANPSYASLKGAVPPLREEDVQKFLDKDTALIEYITTKDALILWVINKKTISPAIVINITGDELNEKVLDFRQSFEDLKNPSKVAQIGQFNILKQFKLTTAEELYNILIKPAEKYLAGSKRIIIVPDGILNYLPFEALVCKRTDKTQSDDILFSKYSGAEYLIEKYAVSYLPSAVLLDPKIQKKKQDISGRFMGFADPSYSQTTGESGQTITRGGVFPRLQYSREELEGIQKLWKDSNKKIYYDKDANESNAKKDIKNYNYIHFSTHGMLDEENPLFSGIVLTQPDPSGVEDGFLETYEIFNLPMSAELVVLSACETGLGKIQRGEGVVGLTRAFMYAGASNIVVTMWSVEDRASNELMKSFYENMITKKEEKAEALRQAKLKLMKEVAVLGEGSNQIKISYSHPFFWAPFVLIGKGK